MTTENLLDWYGDYFLFLPTTIAKRASNGIVRVLGACLWAVWIPVFFIGTLFLLFPLIGVLLVAAYKNEL